jgi:hypothetical protein
MAQFELNTYARKTHPFYDLNDFAKGYVEAMFFTNGDTGDDRENLLNDLGVDRLTRASVAAIKRDCDAFLSKIGPDGCFMRQWLDRAEYSDERAGNDFWFTRQGHGVGFWCRDDELTQEQQDAFCTAAKSFGETHVEVWRGWIHCR